jgi:lycopene cyclase domain-containing protein
MQHYTYLILNLLTLAGPLGLIAHPKHLFYKKLSAVIPAILFTATYFLIWDFFYTKMGVWGFNDDYIIGIRFLGLPIEELLFFITIPYACIFINESIGDYVSKDVFNGKSKYILIVALVFFLLLIPLSIDKKYTLFVAVNSVLVLALALKFLSAYHQSLFLISFSVSIIPMLIVNGILTALPVVWYDDTQNCGVRLYTIPIEDFGYNLVLLLMNSLLFRFFWKKA